MIGRSLLAYRWFPYSEGTAKADAQRVAMMAARAWSPFSEAGLYLVPGRLGMAAWAWRPLDQAVDGIPATLLQKPVQEGARLLRHPDGIEGQVWRDGELRASQYWSTSPDASVWRSFLRSAGIAPDQHGVPPDVVDPVWRAAPLARRLSGTALDISWLPSGFPVHWLEGQRVWRGFLATALFLVALVIGDAARVRVSLSEVEAALSTEEGRFRAVRADRDAVLAATAQQQALLTLLAKPSPLNLMAAVAAALPDDGVRLIDWFQQPTDLNATLIVSKSLDGATLVRRLEAIPGVAGVTLDGAGGSEERVVRLRLVLAR